MGTHEQKMEQIKAECRLELKAKDDNLQSQLLEQAIRYSAGCNEQEEALQARLQMAYTEMTSEHRLRSHLAQSQASNRFLSEEYSASQKQLRDSEAWTDWIMGAIIS